MRVNGYDELIASRMLDFLGPNSVPWQRRLWCVGTTLTLKEVLEASKAVQESILSDSALRDLRFRALRQVGPDPGIGDAPRRKRLVETLRDDIRYGSVDYLVVEQLLDMVEGEYLWNWSETLARATDKPSIEDSARLLASHLLDTGFSREFLFEWWRERICEGGSQESLADMVRQAGEFVGRPLATFEVLIVFEKAPRSRNRQMPPEWRDAQEVSAWLREHSHPTRDLRIGGGLLLKVEARDVWGATHVAVEAVERISARVSIGAKSQVRVHNRVWVASDRRVFPLARQRRGVDVRCLDIENQLYTLRATSIVDNALELIGAMDQAAPAPAVAASWAAMESLLTGPGYGGRRAVAADRASSIVACSFPRAELTQLAHSYASCSNDGLSSAIKVALTNRDRAALLAEGILRGDALTCRTRSDELARGRMQELLHAPLRKLRHVRCRVSDSPHRLYRQRNLVLHWGKVDAVCLDATLRTAAPLVGAALDRIAHAWFVHGMRPLDLAARAELALALVGTPCGAKVYRLLD